MSDKDSFALLSIIESIEKIEEYTKDISTPDDFFSNKIVFDGSLMNFVVIGEMVVRLSDDFKKDHSEIDWNKIKGFRNIVAHDYFGVDAEEVWQIIIRKLKPLKKQLQMILEEGE